MTKARTKIPETIVSLIQPSIQALASRLFVLTAGREGSEKFKPTISDFYETGIVTVLYEHLLMTPLLQHMDIRHEMPYPGSGRGAPKKVDLWMRPFNGGDPHLIEAGDFAVGKVHNDIKKLETITDRGARWFLAFFRDETAVDPWKTIQDSFKRGNGLDANKVEAQQSLTGTFQVYRPDGNHDNFGYSLFKGK